jgi:hypothetical protein
LLSPPSRGTPPDPLKGKVPLPPYFIQLRNAISFISFILSVGSGFGAESGGKSNAPGCRWAHCGDSEIDPVDGYDRFDKSIREDNEFLAKPALTRVLMLEMLALRHFV